MNSVKNTCPKCHQRDNRCVCKEPVFTDDDEKQLKEKTEENRHWHVSTIESADVIWALLARLEAAEDAVLAFHIIPKSNWTERIRLAVDKWRRATGK